MWPFKKTKEITEEITKPKPINSPSLIIDGTETVQLYICPNCGEKVQNKRPADNCIVCKKALCWHCHFDDMIRVSRKHKYHEDWIHLCKEHANLTDCIYKEIEKTKNELQSTS